MVMPNPEPPSLMTPASTILPAAALMVSFPSSKTFMPMVCVAVLLLPIAAAELDAVAAEMKAPPNWLKARPPR